MFLNTDGCIEDVLAKYSGSGGSPCLDSPSHLLHYAKPAGDRSARLCWWRGDGESFPLTRDPEASVCSTITEAACKNANPQKQCVWSQKVSRVTQGIQMLVVQGSHLEKVCLPAEKETGTFSYSVLDEVVEAWVWY